MPSVKFSVDSSGADRGAEKFSAAVDRIVAEAQRAAKAVETMDKAFRGVGQGNVGREMERVVGQLGRVGGAARPVAAEVNTLSGAMRNMSSAAALSFGPLSGLGSRFTAIGSLATRNSVALGGMISVVTGLGAGLALAVKAAADFESAMLRVAKITNASNAELRVQSAEMLKMSSTLGIPATELAKIAESASRFIKGADNIATFTAEVAKLTRTTGLGAEELSNQLAQFYNLTKSTPDQIKGISAAITALGNNFAASEGKIISMALELARGAGTFSVSSDKLLALSASLAAVGERSERSGTAVTQVLIGITQAAAGGKHLEDFARLLGVTNEKFQQLAKQDVGQVFLEVLKRLQQEGPQAINVLQQLQLGSSRNFKVLLTQANAIDEVSRALGIVRGQYANATATDQEFARMNEALNRQLEIAKVGLENLGIAIGSQLIPTLTGGLKGFNNLISLLQGIPPPAGAASKEVQLLAGSIVLLSDAIGTQIPALRLMLDMIGNLATLNPAEAFRNSIAALDRYGQGVKDAYGRIGHDIAALENGRPLKLKIFDDADKDVADARAVSSAVDTLTGNIKDATHAPDALSAAMSTLSKTNEHVGVTFDKSADAVKKALQAMDGDIAAKKALATQGEAAAKAQEEINKLTEKGFTVTAADRAAILAKAQTLVGLTNATKASAKESKEAAKAIEQLDEGLAAFQRDLEKQVKLEGLTESEKAVVELDAKLEEMRVKAIKGGADEATAQKLVNDEYEKAIPLVQRLNAERSQKAVDNANQALREEIQLLVLESEQGKIAADTQRILNDLKKQGVDNVDQYAGSIRKSVEELAKLKKQQEASAQAWTAIDSAFQQTVDGFINGTLKMDDIWRSFTAGLLKNFVDSIGGVSGLFEKLVGGAKGIFTGSAGIKDKDGNSVGFLEGIGGGIDRFRDPVYARNSDGSIAKDAKGNPIQATNPDGSLKTSFNYGAAAGAAIQGGATAYSLFRGVDDTRLQGLIAKGTESGVISASNNIGQIFGAIIGAVASVWLGPVGGVIGGVVGSVLSSVIVGSVSRHSFLNGGKLDDPFGKAGTPQGGLWDPSGTGVFLEKAIEFILALPTLGLAMRKGAESLLDNSETFKGLQARFGDVTVRSGGREHVYRNNLTGSDTALGRGWTQGQVDLTEGATAAIFGQLAKGELPEDAGRLGEAMGRIMAEFLSRGAAEGVDFKPMFDQLRLFAHEAGIDLFTTMRSLDKVMEQSIAAATTWGKLDPMAAATQGARAYAEAFVGATEVFEGDFPAGVHLASIALQSMEKDGQKLFGTLDKEGHQALVNLTDDTELTMETVQKLIEQGWSIDIEGFEDKVKAIAASASVLNETVPNLFDASSFEAGFSSILTKLRDTIKQQLGQGFMSQLFDKTDIASVFEPVFELLGRLDEFDLSQASGRDSFMQQMLPAIAQGRANLEEYLPILREMYEKWKEIEKQVDDALAPTKAEILADAIAGAFSGLGSLIGDAIEAGVDILSSGGTMDEALRAFNTRFGSGLQTALKTAVFNAILDTAIIQPLIAKYQPAFKYIVSAGLEYGFQDPRVLAAWNLVMGQIQDDAARVGPLLLQAAADTDGLDHGLTKFFERMQKDIDDLNQNLASTFTSTITSAITEAMKNGKAVDLNDLRENLYATIYEAVVNAMVEAMVSAAIIQGGLAPLLEQLKVLSADAWRDGVLDAGEQAAIGALVTRIGEGGLKLADAMITGLQPILDLIYGLPGVAGGAGGGSAGRGKGHYETQGGDIVWVPDGRQVPDLTGHGGTPPATTGGNPDSVPPATTGGNPDATKTAEEKWNVAMTNVSDGMLTMAKGMGTIGDTLDSDVRGDMLTLGLGLGTLGDAAKRLGDYLDSLRPTPTPAPTDTGVDGGRAAGGTMRNGQRFIVGERGPELVDMGNGFATVTPLSVAEASALLGYGIPGYASGGTVNRTGPDLNPGSGPRQTLPPQPRNGGTPGYKPTKVPPPPGHHPGSTGIGQVHVEVSLGLDDAISEFLRGGSLRDFQDALNTSAREAVLEGLIKGMLESGPIKTAIDKFNNKMTVAVNEAMRDGVIDGTEQANLDKLATELTAGIDTAVQGAKPAVDAVTKALGLGVEHEVGSGLREALEDAFTDFAKTGDVQAAKDAIHEAFNEAALTGIIDALLAEGPIADAIKGASTEFADAMKDALADGVISQDEADHLKTLGEELGANLEKAFSGLDPAITALFGGMTDKATEAMKKAGDLASGALKGLLNDPKNLNFKSFSESLRQAIYQNVAGGLIDAFINAAIIQGALAPMLAAIQLIFDAIGKKQLGIAEANGMIATQIGLMLDVLNDPTFKEAIGTLLTGISDIGHMLDAFPNAAADAAGAAGAVSDAVNQANEDVCAGKCGLKEEVKGLGQTVLDATGRTGSIEDVGYVPTYNGIGNTDGRTPTTTDAGDDGRFNGIDHDRDPLNPYNIRRGGGSGTWDGGSGEWGRGPHDGSPWGNGQGNWRSQRGRGPGDSWADWNGPGGDWQAGTGVDEANLLPPGDGAHAASTASFHDDEELTSLVEEMRDEIKDLRLSLAEQPVIVNADVRVDQDKVIHVMAKAKRAARAAGFQGL